MYLYEPFGVWDIQAKSGWLWWLSNVFKWAGRGRLVGTTGAQESEGSSPKTGTTITWKENLRKHLKGNSNKLIGMWYQGTPGFPSWTQGWLHYEIIIKDCCCVMKKRKEFNKDLGPLFRRRLSQFYWKEFSWALVCGYRRQIWFFRLCKMITESLLERTLDWTERQGLNGTQTAFLGHH